MIDTLNQAYDDAVQDGLTDASSLHDLGIELLHCGKELGDVGDINKCVWVMQEVVRLTPDGHPDKSLRLDNLGYALFTRFKQLGDLDDLNKSVSMGEDAVHLTPDGHLDKPSRLNNLGNSLLHRFEQCGDLDDLNKSVSMREDAVRLTPNGHPDKPSRLSNLGNSLLRRFEQHGDVDDLNKSVSMGEDAVRLTPHGHPDKPSWLNNLGNSLLHRFGRCGDLADLDKSVSMGEDAVHLTADGHPDKPLRLSNLGGSFLCRFEQHSDVDDLNKSVSMREDAIDLTPDGHPDKPSRLSNLGNSLLRRFEQHGDVDDLNKSVSMGEDAVCLTPDGHSDKPSMLNNLGNSLLHRFGWCSDLDDLNKSVSMREDAVRLTPDGHPDKPSWLNNLGNSLSRRFESCGDHAALQQAISVYALASRSTTGPAHIRFHAASNWAQHARIGEDLSLMEAYHVAIDLLPELAWLGLSISNRHHHLSRVGKVVRDGAAVAITSERAEKAVEWLEQGRSVIWSRLLNLRSPVDGLKHSHPKLAHRLVSLSAQLEGSGTRTSAESIQSGTLLSPQSVADRAHHNAHERGELLKEIRQLEGFERFLLPKTISELSPAAQKGPVVILNITDTQCDALVLIPGLDDEVMHIPLNDFKADHAGSMAQSLRDLVGQSERLGMARDGQTNPSRGSMAQSLGDLVGRSERLVIREGQMNPRDEFEHILSQLWKEIAKPVLDALAITVSDSFPTPAKANLPRIWWCPTSPLGSLPIHAAGLYGKDDAFGSKLSDFVISSYAPLLTALNDGFRSPSKPQKALQLLAVSQPSAVGQAHIPGTRKELQHIQQFANGKLPVLQLDQDEATVEYVQQGMRDSSWVHFACHGVQSVSHPTESALLLAGSERLTFSSIIQLVLPHANFAFLSACQTATGDKGLEEESVHLAAGMQLVGYRGVIATMWTIMDEDAPQVASDVYEHLLKVSPPDPARAAEALHLAIRNLREESGGRKSFFHWVPFIHIGV
ncbi:CHAT domain-containing protein [Mycena leptocephala]|nr:CHAT domain-containing protein [Mycena leptocephala]